MSTAIGGVLPAVNGVRVLWEQLLGRDVTVTPANAAPSGAMTVAEFCDDRGRLRVLAVADLALTVWAGCALGLIPPGGAEDQIAEGSASASALDNFHEVLNVSTSLFNQDGPHVRLTTLHAPGADLPAELAELARRSGDRRDLTVEIARYGTGRLSFVLA
jgi:hypothetical protein